MAVADEYRKHAEKCRILAEAAPKSSDRAFWLLLAQNWQLLAQDVEAEPPEELQGTE
jgi:phytoene/squalene synthetase